MARADLTQNQKVLGKLKRFVSERRRLGSSEKGNAEKDEIEMQRLIKK